MVLCYQCVDCIKTPAVVSLSNTPFLCDIGAVVLNALIYFMLVVISTFHTSELNDWGHIITGLPSFL